MAPSPTVRRLLKETAELSASCPKPSPAFYASPVSDSDLYEWHFTLLGPPSPSPYAGGIYHGRITLPPSYPLKPPNFRFLTPSGRFEVNREICLSISGFHEETWMPAWGVRTALTALRSFMAEKGTAGQVGGLESSEEVRKRLAKDSRRWTCEACGVGGGKSNEDVMKDWWAVCAEKGIKVEEDENIDLDALPDGMTVEARTPGTGTGTGGEKGKQRESSEVAEPVDTHSSSPPPPPPPPSLPISSPPTFQVSPNTPAQASYQTPQAISSQPIPPTPISTTINHPPPTPTQPLRQIPVVPAPPSYQQRPHQRYTTTTTPNTNEPQTTITIDRAITIIFLALCIMVLKKIFYPAGPTGWEYDDLKMARE